MWGSAAWPIVKSVGVAQTSDDEGPLPTKTAKTEAPAKQPVRILCMQCDKVEIDCKCDRYCCICQSQECIRLCLDGLFYCTDCGTACDLPPVEQQIE